MSGDSGLPFMQVTAKTLGDAIPGAKLRTLAGQTHNVDPDILAPALVEFFED